MLVMRVFVNYCYWGGELVVYTTNGCVWGSMCV